ncbi:hypothetical protein ACSHWB_02330 [Lentzea sp. HUAS TT2]|uniref:hypothetical protein n=1 Tax=Lentzea sp. HUAS TT2 TaxID=3447454 RepID=UPI003F720E0C
MSSHLFIGEDCWNQSSGSVGWALDVIAGHVTNEAVAAELRAFSSGLVFVEDFGRTYGAEASEEIVHVIRTKLRAAALAEPEGEAREYTVEIVDELVAMAERWRGFEVEAG